MANAALSSYERYPGAATQPLTPSYRRREPEKTVLHDIVDRNLTSCLEAAQDKTEHGYGYPRFVEREFEKFLGCGLLRRGFVRVKCADCPNEKLIAFSCKGRGLCPSCTARRMANTAAHLVDNVLPEVPYRQWVISFPKRVRFLLARDHTLLSAVLALCLRKIFAWQRRRARTFGVTGPMCGAVSFVQRFGSLVNLNCHFHCLLPDGVFVDEDGRLEFRPTPPPEKNDLERLVRQIARATEKLLAHHAQAFSDDETPDAHALEQARSLRANRVPGQHDSGQERTSAKQQSAFIYGYSLHAARVIQADDREGLERLCRYGARAPIANSRLSLNSAGDAVIELKRPMYDGRTHLVCSQLELLQKLAILIPPPRKNLTRYFGVFAPAHRHRAAIVAKASTPLQPSSEPNRTVNRKDGKDTPNAWNSARLSWAELLRRVFAIDVLTCEQCGGSMRILAVIPQSDISDKILDHLEVDGFGLSATGPPAQIAAGK